MDTRHYFKCGEDGRPYFRIPELELNPPNPNSTQAEKLLQSMFTRTLMEQFNAAYLGKGRYDYNVTLPMNVLAFWDKFDLGILREYARLLPENFREMLILPFVRDESQTEYYVNELRIVANEAIIRRSEEEFKQRNNGIWNNPDSGEPTAAFTSQNFEMEFEPEVQLTKPPPGFAALPDISRRVIGRERELWKHEERQQKKSADVLSPSWLPPQEFAAAADPQGVFSPWDFPSLPTSPENQQDFRSTRWFTESQPQQFDTRYQGGDGRDHVLNNSMDGPVWQHADQTNQGWTWPAGYSYKSQDILDGFRSNKFQSIIGELKAELEANPESGFTIRKLPDVTSTHQLFSDVAYRGHTNSSADLLGFLDGGRPNMQSSSADTFGKIWGHSCDSYGFFNSDNIGYQRISHKARDNFQDIYGNHTIFNSKIGRYEVFSTLRYCQAAQPSYFPPPPPPQDLGLEDSYETPIRYTFHTENYDPLTLQPVRHMEPVPPIEIEQASASTSFQVPDDDDDFRVELDEEFQKIAENILEDSNSSTVDTEEFEDYSEEEEEEEVEEEEDGVDDQPPIIEINCSRYKTYRANASMAGSHRLPSSRRRRNYLCVFCKGNNEPEEVYKSHPIRVNGEVMCPFLRNHVCAICKNTGHTIKYCPQNRRGFFAQKALEKSKSLTKSTTFSPFNKGVEHTLVFTPSSGHGTTRNKSRRPSTAPASLPTQKFPQDYEERRNQVENFDNNYRGAVLMVKKGTDQAFGSGSRTNTHRGTRKGRGGAKKKRAQNFKSI